MGSMMDATGRRQGTLIHAIGIAGAGLMVLADLLMLYAPVSRMQYDFLEVARSIPEMRVIAGDYLGLLGVSMVLVGLYGIYIVLRPAGRGRSLPPILLLAYAYVLGAVFHHAVGMTMASARQEGLGGVADIITADLVASFLQPLGVAFLIVVVVGSGWLFVTLLLTRIAYPRWMAFLSPLVLVLAFRAVILVGSPAVVGALVPAGPNLAMLLFFIASTAWLRIHPPGSEDLGSESLKRTSRRRVGLARTVRKFEVRIVRPAIFQFPVDLPLRWQVFFLYQRVT